MSLKAISNKPLDKSEMKLKAKSSTGRQSTPIIVKQVSERTLAKKIKTS